MLLAHPNSTRVAGGAAPSWLQPHRSRTDDKTLEQLSRRCHITTCSIVICSRLSRDRPLLTLLS